MMSFLPASISLRALSASVAAVGVGAFLAGRQSLPAFVASPSTVCSTATEADFPEETPYLTENDAAINKMMQGEEQTPRRYLVIAEGHADKPGPIVQVQLK